MANSKNAENNSNGKSFRAIITSTPAWISAIAALITAIITAVALWYPGDGGDGDGRPAASNQENSSKTSGTTPTRVPGSSRVCQSLATLIGVRGGVCVVEVIPGSPAATAGVKVGDLITDVGGRSVEDVDEWDMLLEQTPTGGRVLLSITREGAPKPRIYVRVKLERIEGSKLRLGVRVEDTVPQQRGHG